MLTSIQQIHTRAGIKSNLHRHYMSPRLVPEGNSHYTQVNVFFTSLNNLDFLLFTQMSLDQIHQGHLGSTRNFSVFLLK